MGLKTLTIKTKNGDSAHAGTALFNGDLISGLRLYSTDDSFFEYPQKKHEAGIVKDKFVVDETLTSSDDIFTAVNTTFYTIPIHDDINDATSSTTNKAIKASDIMFAIALPSNTYKSLVWIRESGKVEKYLVSKTLYQLEDYIMTGSTTTSTTTTSTTTTSTTSTTSTTTTSS